MKKKIIYIILILAIIAVVAIRLKSNKETTKNNFLFMYRQTH